MRERIQRFMIGRNGADTLSRFFMILSAIALVVTLFTNNPISYVIALVCVGYSYFRIMSKNVQKRYYENQKFMDMTYGIRRRFSGTKQKAAYQKSKVIYDYEQRKIYRIYHCPSCKQKIRVPRGKGKICITCPKCKMEFLKRS